MPVSRSPRAWRITAPRLARAALSLLVGISAGTGWLLVAAAQQPVGDPLDNGPPALGAGELPPTLPETVVTPGVYPSQPLSDDVAFTPTQTENQIGQTGTSITVITEKQIKETGQTSVAEILRGKVGIDTVRSGGPGGQTSVFLRGANSAQTKVLLDGIPVNDPSGPSRAFDFSTLDVENIERIEILRGPQSLLYGSDAVGGVINIITKRGNGPSTARVSGHGGSFGTARIGGVVSGGDEKKYYSVGGSYLDTAGISQASTLLGNTERDGFQNGTASGRFGFNPTENLNIDYVFRFTDSRAEIDNFNINTFVFEDDLNALLLQESFVNRIQLQSLFLDGGIEQVMNFGLTDYTRRDTSPSAFSRDFAGQSRILNYYLNFLLTERNTLTAGTQYYVEDASDSNTADRSQNYAGVYLQDQWRFLDNWYVSAGVRHDDHSVAGHADTYRATTVYNVLPTATDLHGSVGTGFRAPALVELSFSSGVLLPETSVGYDAGITQYFANRRGSFDATYFHNDFRDLIDFNFNTFLLENIGRARTQGVELTSDWLLTDNTRLFGMYTFTDAINLETGNQLARRPRDKVTIGFDQYFWDRIARVGGQMLFVGERVDSGNLPLDQYTIVNFNGSLKLTERAELFGRIDNAFNEQYVEIAGYGTPGTGVYGGLNVVW